jgi:threonine synthase
VGESGGTFVTVTDDEILAAQRDLASFGVFGEPAGVAGVAGIRRARAEGVVGSNDRVLHVVTGSGLKDVKSARRAAGLEALSIAPSLDAVHRALTGSTR